jgi:hypothetical protein
MQTKMAAGAGALLALGLLFASSTSALAVCVGNCGTATGPDGDVTGSPLGGEYSWISTINGSVGGGTLASLGFSDETNGSHLSTAINVAVGDVLKFYFNYVTSDGAGYADYAWAQLQPVGPGTAVTLFTARTTPGGDTVPGFGMPAPNATLTPASTPIQPGTSPTEPGGPVWSPLGGDSGKCYDDGCGLTGWILSEYTVTDAGSFNLVFGVTNWDDQGWGSGMAIAGLKINDVEVPIGGEVPLPGSLPLFSTGLAGMGWLVRRRKRKAVG